MKTCSKCRKPQTEGSFNPSTKYKDGLKSWCKTCVQSYNRKWRRTLGKNYYAEHKDVLNAQSRAHRGRNPESRLWIGAKTRARQKGLPFNLKLTDIVIPKRCPALGILLQSSVGDAPVRAIDSSPSLDRFKPELGYVAGNVFVISRFANIIKNNATAEQVLAVGRWMKRMETK